MDVVKVLCFLLVLLTIKYSAYTFQIKKDEYLKLRNNVLRKEYQMRIGGKVRLSDAELRVNDTLMKLKAKELDVARTNTTNFPPAVHFFRAKPLIDKSEVFNMIRNMPKGTWYILQTYMIQFRCQCFGLIDGIGYDILISA